MFRKGHGIWVNLLNDALVTHDINMQSTINLSPADASNQPDKVKYNFGFRNVKIKHKIIVYVRNADKRKIFSK